MTNNGSTGLFTFSQRAHYWNELYEHPSSLFEHNMVLRRDYAKQYICTHFDKSSSILDLGCGAGVLSEKLIESSFTVTAVDDSQDMLDLSRERLKRFPAESCKLLHANCLSLPFDDGQFDLVVCLGVFGYFDEVTQALREIHRVLRPGGKLIISVRNAHTADIFDLFRLVKLPFRLMRAVARRLSRRPQQPDSPRNASSAAQINGGIQIDDGFRIQIYQVPSRLIAGVTQRGYALTEFDGIGYGPLAFAERKLLSPHFSVKFSDFLNRIFRASGLNRFSRWFADVSFYVFRRED